MAPRNLRTIAMMVFVGIATVFSLPLAQAQPGDSDDRWQFFGAIYGWGAGMDGKTQAGDPISVSFSDLVDNLNLAFMGGIGASRGQWSLVLDLMYLDLSGDRSGSFEAPVGETGRVLELPGHADLDMTGWVVTPTIRYQVWEGDKGTVDVLAGARYLDLDNRLKLRVTTPRGRVLDFKTDASGNVWDAIVGIRGVLNLSDRWYLRYYGDIGTGQSDLTWQLGGGIGYRINDRWNAVALYRHLRWDFDSDKALDNLEFSGPMLGAGFRF